MIEDTLGYGEPPQWLQPVRHTLGAVYLKDGRYADAERVYRADLAKWRGNGWSLYGLSRGARGAGQGRGSAGEVETGVPARLGRRGRGDHDQLQVHPEDVIAARR